MALHFAERAAVHGEVLRVHVHRAALNLAVAGDDAFAQILLRRQSGLITLMRDERFEFVERAVIEQLLQAFTRRQLAFGVLFGNPIGPAADAGFFAHGAQFQNARVFLSHKGILSMHNSRPAKSKERTFPVRPRRGHCAL